MPVSNKWRIFDDYKNTGWLTANIMLNNVCWWLALLLPVNDDLVLWTVDNITRAIYDIYIMK